MRRLIAAAILLGIVALATVTPNALPAVGFFGVVAIKGIAWEVAASVRNLVTSEPQTRYRFDVRVMVDGQEHEISGVYRCVERYKAALQTIGTFTMIREVEGSGGHVGMTLPDGRVIEAGADFHPCPPTPERHNSLRSLPFYLIAQKADGALVTAARYSSVSTSRQFRVDVGPITETNQGVTATDASLPTSVRERIRWKTIGYAATYIESDVWASRPAVQRLVQSIKKFQAIEAPDREADRALHALRRERLPAPASAALSSDFSRVDVAEPANAEVGIIRLNTNRQELLKAGGPSPSPRACIRTNNCAEFSPNSMRTDRLPNGFFFDPVSKTIIYLQVYQ